MKIDFEGRGWLLEMDEVTVKQGERIQAYTGGLTPSAWYQSLLRTEDAGWLKSMQCLYWLIHEQNQDPVVLEDTDFAPLKLMTAFGEASAPEEAPEPAAEADPTKPAGPPGGTGPAELPKSSPAG